MAFLVCLASTPVSSTQLVNLRWYVNWGKRLPVPNTQTHLILRLRTGEILVDIGYQPIVSQHTIFDMCPSPLNPSPVRWWNTSSIDLALASSYTHQGKAYHCFYLRPVDTNDESSEGLLLGCHCTYSVLYNNSWNYVERTNVSYATLQWWRSELTVCLIR